MSGFLDGNRVLERNLVVARELPNRTSRIGFWRFWDDEVVVVRQLLIGEIITICCRVRPFHGREEPKSV
jgi:hypothetical protein